MRTAGVIVNLVAAAAALYDGKILVWDIAVADVRAGSGGVIIVVFAVIVSGAFAALPLGVGLRWALAGRGAALLVAMASLLLSGGGFVILAAAFTP